MVSVADKIRDVLNFLARILLDIFSAVFDASDQLINMSPGVSLIYFVGKVSSGSNLTQRCHFIHL